MSSCKRKYESDETFNSLVPSTLSPRQFYPSPPPSSSSESDCKKENVSDDEVQYTSFNFQHPSPLQMFMYARLQDELVSTCSQLQLYEKIHRIDLKSLQDKVNQTREEYEQLLQLCCQETGQEETKDSDAHRNDLKLLQGRLSKVREEYEQLCRVIAKEEVRRREISILHHDVADMKLKIKKLYQVD